MKKFFIANKKAYFFRVFILWLLVSLEFLCFGQQNLFNIPSGDITRKNKIFYQHQINLYNSKLESKAHFVYGLGSGWDAGINIVGKGLFFTPEWRITYNDNPDRGALYPYVMVTLQKQFQLSENFDINIGTQGGYNISRKITNKEFAFFNYGLGVFYFMDKKSRVVGGIYHTKKCSLERVMPLGLYLDTRLNYPRNFI